MFEQTDIESLARRFLDLWQEQLAAMATDPEFANSAERFMSAFDPGRRGGATGDPSADPDDAAGTAAASTAYGTRDDELRRLERRVAALEERLAAFEGAASASGS